MADFRAGDVVFHRPSGETWVLAFGEDDRVSACGWPESLAQAADCDLVEACSDAEHVAMLRKWSGKPGRHDYRVVVCARQLAARAGDDGAGEGGGNG